ncbi:unnamed protein product, partial [Amoebophrya sp. A120]
QPREILLLVPEPPDLKELEHSVDSLSQMGALTGIGDDADPTILAHLMIALPIDARLCRLIVDGALFGCLPDALLVVVGLSQPEPFSQPSHLVIKDDAELGKRNRASATVRRIFDAGACSEPLMLRNLLAEWLVQFARYKVAEADRIKEQLRINEEHLLKENQKQGRLYSEMHGRWKRASKSSLQKATSDLTYEDVHEEPVSQDGHHGSSSSTDSGTGVVVGVTEVPVEETPAQNSGILQQVSSVAEKVRVSVFGKAGSGGRASRASEGEAGRPAAGEAFIGWYTDAEWKMLEKAYADSLEEVARLRAERRKLLQPHTQYSLFWQFSKRFASQYAGAIVPKKLVVLLVKLVELLDRIEPFLHAESEMFLQVEVLRAVLNPELVSVGERNTATHIGSLFAAPVEVLLTVLTATFSPNFLIGRPKQGAANPGGKEMQRLVAMHQVDPRRAVTLPIEMPRELVAADKWKSVLRDEVLGSVAKDCEVQKLVFDADNSQKGGQKGRKGFGKQNGETVQGRVHIVFAETKSDKATDEDCSTSCARRDRGAGGPNMPTLGTVADHGQQDPEVGALSAEVKQAYSGVKSKLRFLPEGCQLLELYASGRAGNAQVRFPLNCKRGEASGLSANLAILSNATKDEYQEIVLGRPTSSLKIQWELFAPEDMLSTAENAANQKELNRGSAAFRKALACAQQRNSSADRNDIFSSARPLAAYSPFDLGDALVCKQQVRRVAYCASNKNPCAMAVATGFDQCLTEALDKALGSNDVAAWTNASLLRSAEAKPKPGVLVGVFASRVVQNTQEVTKKDVFGLMGPQAIENSRVEGVTLLADEDSLLATKLCLCFAPQEYSLAVDFELATGAITRLRLGDLSLSGELPLRCCDAEKRVVDQISLQTIMKANAVRAA